jgi:hypothetical protein
MLSTLLTLFVLGFVGLLVVGVVLAVIGVVFGLAVGVASFLLFKVAPILLIGWVVLKLVSRARGHRQISAADQRWLDS